MDFDLLSAVQPDEGWTAVVGIRNGKVIQHFCETREETDAQIERFRKRDYDVYFGVAKYRDGLSKPEDGGGRTKQNVLALKALWADLDCGPDKKYSSQASAFAALQQFIGSTGLPKPAVVNSGRGVHAYWPLAEALSREEWEPLNARLKELCSAEGLHADPTCFEAARILRVPGTFNYKGEDPLPVEVWVPGKPTQVEKLRELLGAEEAVAPLPFASRRGVSLLAQEVQAREGDDLP